MASDRFRSDEDEPIDLCGEYSDVDTDTEVSIYSDVELGGCDGGYFSQEEDPEPNLGEKIPDGPYCFYSSVQDRKDKEEEFYRERERKRERKRRMIRFLNVPHGMLVCHRCFS